MDGCECRWRQTVSNVGDGAVVGGEVKLIAAPGEIIGTDTDPQGEDQTEESPKYTAL